MNKQVEAIRAEIERLLHDYTFDSVTEALHDTLAFIDSLPEEKPSKGLDVTDFCKPIDPGIAQCIADNWWEMLGEDEQPKADLEKEIENYFKGWYMDETDQGYILHTPYDYAGLMSVKQVARHFYEFGLKARKEE